jgi:hypothetical protein
MNTEDLRVNASFGLERGYFTLDFGLVRLGFLRVGEEEEKGFCVNWFCGGFCEECSFYKFFF